MFTTFLNRCYYEFDRAHGVFPVRVMETSFGD